VVPRAYTGTTPDKKKITKWWLHSQFQICLHWHWHLHCVSVLFVCVCVCCGSAQCVKCFAAPAVLLCSYLLQAHTVVIMYAKFMRDCDCVKHTSSAMCVCQDVMACNAWCTPGPLFLCKYPSPTMATPVFLRTVTHTRMSTKQRFPHIMMIRVAPVNFPVHAHRLWFLHRSH